MAQETLPETFNHCWLFLLVHYRWVPVVVSQGVGIRMICAVKHSMENVLLAVSQLAELTSQLHIETVDWLCVVATISCLCRCFLNQIRFSCLKSTAEVIASVAVAIAME